MKPDSKNCPIEWSYPERKGSVRLMLMGVDNCWAGLGGDWMDWGCSYNSVLWLNPTSCGTKITVESAVGVLTFKTIMPKGTGHSVTTPMVSGTKTPRHPKIGHKLSSACRGLHSLCTDRARGTEPRLPMNSTPWKGSSRDMSQKTKNFIVKAPVLTPGGKVLDGGVILHKARTVTWKVGL